MHGFIGLRKAVERLIELGVDIHAKNTNNDTPLTLAASTGLRKAVKMLIAKGADVNGV